MEYTKDLIFSVHYDEVSSKLEIRQQKWTSRFFKKVKKHKVVTTSVLMASIFIIMDLILLFHFIQIIGTI